MTRLTPADFLPWVSLLSTRGTPSKRASNLRPQRSCGARPTRICRSFGAFRKEFPHAAESKLALSALHPVSYDACDDDHAPLPSFFSRAAHSRDCLSRSSLLCNTRRG